jgi:tRNA(Ile)-lysidine synthase
MRQVFISGIQKSQTVLPNQRFLLACSGGMDSMALAHLLLSAGIYFEIAHVNFQLRGEESEGDKLFVENWAKTRQIAFHLKTADTKSVAESKGISVQMAAREIRYDFFEEIRAAFQLDGILLAQHQDDQLETIFMNLLRGTGIEGLSGMSEKKGWLIRPLLNFSRAEIAEFMFSEGYEWREDSSNEKSDYKRNNLRINGLPAIYGLAPDAKKNLLCSFKRLKDTGKAFSGLFEFWKEKTVREKDGIQSLTYSDITHLPGGASLLYFWLRSYGFHSEQAEAIWEAITTKVRIGSVFTGKNHQLWMDRNEMMLAPISGDFNSIPLDKSDGFLNLPERNYEIRWFEENKAIDINPENAVLDLECLELPLTVRIWEEGDRFIPLGMKNEKKISDFLIDLKIPLAKKQGVKVLISGEKIAWVIGIRIADWAKLTPTTRQTVHFKKI